MSIFTQAIVIFVVLALIYYLFTHYYKQAEPFMDNGPGLTPIVLRNSESLPIVPIKVASTPALFTARMIRKMVFPCEPEIFTTHEGLLSSLKPDELGIVREYEVLEAKTKGLCSCAPVFAEVCIALASKETLMSNIADILKPRPDGTRHKVGVVKDSMRLFKAICKNRDIRLGLANGPFTVIEHDRAQDAFVALGTREVDLVFYLAHPKDTVLQTYCATNPVRLLDLEPEEGVTTKPNRPYNKEDIAPVSQFRQNMKRDVPWLFLEKMSIDKIPNASLSVIKGASRTTGDVTIARYVYSTYKVRSLVVFKDGGQIFNAKVPTVHMPGFANRFIRSYQTMSRLFNDWNPISGDNSADNSDLFSFDFQQLATIQGCIPDAFKAELIRVGLIQRDTDDKCGLTPPSIK